MQGQTVGDLRKLIAGLDEADPISVVLVNDPPVAEFNATIDVAVGDKWVTIWVEVISADEVED